MPRYFFHITDGTSFVDTKGTELPDLATARCVAVDIIANQLKGNGTKFWQVKDWQVEISGEGGSALATITVTAHDMTLAETPVETE